MNHPEDSVTDLDPSEAVGHVMKFWRALWQSAFPNNSQSDRTKSPFRCFDIGTLRQQTGIQDEIFSTTINRLRLSRAPLAAFISPGKLQVHISALKPLDLVRNVLHEMTEADLRYHVRRNIREEYSCSFSPAIAHAFESYVTLLNKCLFEGTVGARGLKKGESSTVWEYYLDFLPCLESAQKDAFHSDDNTYIHAFVETCLMVGYIEPYMRPGFVRFSANVMETEFLISHLFGLPTSITGFDTLFGGGGIILPESLRGVTGHSGRVLLLRGRFGTGKTLLALQMAIEVARKGGVAWIIPIEQSVQEYLYTIESMALANKCNISLATDPVSAVSALNSEHNDHRGVLVLLRTPRDSLGSFLNALRDNAAHLRRFALRLLVADPINAVARDRDADMAQMRRDTSEALNEIKNQGTNVLLVAEEVSESEGGMLFEQNVSDTVVRLSVEKRHGYTQRYLEITKSRLQREQRGEHAFSIRPGTGVRVFPSTAAVSARIAPRKPVTELVSIRFGLSSLDELLGPSALCVGDVIALQGPSGCHKTTMGLAFLKGLNVPPKATTISRKVEWSAQAEVCSLLIAARDDELTIRNNAQQEFLRENVVQGDKSSPLIKIQTLPHCYVNPGAVFQQIEEEFSRAKANGYRVHRVMIDNIAHWEMAYPFVRSDETFADTMIRFLRRKGVTTLIVCGEPALASESVLQRAILDNADTIIRLTRPILKGRQCIIARVTKTRGIDYHRGASEVVMDKRGLALQPSSPLLRFNENGDAEAIRIRLLLHSESDSQAQYNERLKRSLETMLANHVAIDSVEKLFAGQTTRLGAFSAIDELQVCQLDEFQIPHNPRAPSSEIALYPFSASSWPDHFVDRIQAKFQRRGQCHIVPYFENISLLAYRNDARDSLSHDDVKTWEKLAVLCRDWESNHGNNEVFFEFPKGSPENYNCLFFEILLSLIPPPSESSTCALTTWLNTPEAIRACELMWLVARRAHKRSKQRIIEPGIRDASYVFDVPKDAVVWRHWYTTLNQMLGGMSGHEERSSICVSPLPNNIAVAGEWYLGIPAYSAAPEVGLEIIKTLTSRQAEVERLTLGVGLPTRKAFYQDSSEYESLVSPYFAMDIQVLQRLVANAFSRSQFGCYQQVATIIAYHLQRILEVDSESFIRTEAHRILSELKLRLRFLGPFDECRDCFVRLGVGRKPVDRPH